jgi:hypothetical protein
MARDDKIYFTVVDLCIDVMVDAIVEFNKTPLCQQPGHRRLRNAGLYRLDRPKYPQGFEDIFRAMPFQD